MNEIDKKKIKRLVVLASVVVVFCIVAIIGSTYAIFHFRDEGGTQELTFGDFAVNFIQSGNAIQIANGYPVSDDEGQAQAPLTFTIENTSGANAKYELSIQEDETNTLSSQSLRYSLIKNGQETASGDLSDLLLNSNQLLSSKQTDTYELRIWIREDADNDIQGKIWNGKVQVTAVQEDGEMPLTIAPKIVLNGDSTVYLHVGDNYMEPGISSITDHQGESISLDQVETTIEYYDGTNSSTVDTIDTSRMGVYYIYYKVKDKNGNQGVIARSVVINAVNTTPPEITLLGNNPFVVNIGEDYVEPGATAVDADGTNISQNISTVQSVQGNVLGTYIVKYYVADKYGNIGSATRTVSVLVKDEIAPSTPNVVITVGSPDGEEYSSGWTNQSLYPTLDATDNEGGSGVFGYEFSLTNDPENTEVWTMTNDAIIDIENLFEQVGHRYFDGDIYVRTVDLSGNRSDIVSFHISIDQEMPTCSVSGTDGAWTNQDIQLVGTCTDQGSGCESETISKNFTTTMNEKVSPGVVRDKAGNETTCTTTFVRIDKTPPSCESSGASTTWQSSQTITGVCNDTDSGCRSDTQTISKEFTSSTNGNQSPGDVYDNAGNKTTCPGVSVMVDTDPPTKVEVSMHQGSASGETYTSGWTNQPVYQTFSSTDVSGIKGFEYALVNEPDNDAVWTLTTNSTLTTADLIAKQGGSGTDFNGTVYVRAVSNRDEKGEITSYQVMVDQTPPTCSVSGGNSSWTNQNVTITGTCSDNLSQCTGNATRTFSESGTYYNGSYSPGYVYDQAGNSTYCGTTTVMVDKKAPSCSSSGGGSSWTSSSVTITGTCSEGDGESGCVNTTVSRPFTSNTDGNYSPGTVQDNAGNTTTCPTRGVHIDQSYPSCSTSGGSSSWRRSATLRGNCTANGPSSCSDVTRSFSSETYNGSYSPGSVCNEAGLCTSCPSATVKIDRTSPTASVSINCSSGTVSKSCSDSRSSCSTSITGGNVSSISFSPQCGTTYSVTVTATDSAGNTDTDSASCTTAACCTLPADGTRCTVSQAGDIQTCNGTSMVCAERLQRAWWSYQGGGNNGWYGGAGTYITQSYCNYIGHDGKTFTAGSTSSTTNTFVRTTQNDQLITKYSEPIPAGQPMIPTSTWLCRTERYYEWDYLMT